MVRPAAAAPQAVHGGATGAPALHWRPCEEPAQRGFECATFDVPLDHCRPAGETIRLAVIRHKATNPSARIGSLFFNPGGPGGSGTVSLPQWYEKFFPAELRERDTPPFASTRPTGGIAAGGGGLAKARGHR
ncbi:hypothetical protein GCM10009535_54910 [Streptomyces thermocarboxydovorans]|uniref:Uncharacterized protein n=1 Tax=Streptomyces thermocarboxydovorans TaxID=59298 RepID=A0ABN1HUE3_9ACTN